MASIQTVLQHRCDRLCKGICEPLYFLVVEKSHVDEKEIIG